MPHELGLTVAAAGQLSPTVTGCRVSPRSGRLRPAVALFTARRRYARPGPESRDITRGTGPSVRANSGLKTWTNLSFEWWTSTSAWRAGDLAGQMYREFRQAILDGRLKAARPCDPAVARPGGSPSSRNTVGVPTTACRGGIRRDQDRRRHLRLRAPGGRGPPWTSATSQELRQHPRWETSPRRDGTRSGGRARDRH